MSDLILNKVKGIMYGLAIGDALGRSTEFISLQEIKNIYGENGIQSIPENALYTDDTQMTLLIVKALLKSGEYDCETIMSFVRDEFVNWVYSDEWRIGGAGKACTVGSLNMKNGINWSKSGVKNSKGCGSVMRVLPVGYLYQNDVDKLREVSYSTGICTHYHPTANAACIGAAYIVKLLFDGVNIFDIIPKLLKFTENISDEWDDAISKVEECLDWSDEEKALKYLGEGWIAEEAVSLALYCFFKYQFDYKKVVIRAANTNGDSDSIACIAGGFSGAYLGISAIPTDWVLHINNSKYIEEISNKLFEKRFLES